MQPHTHQIADDTTIDQANDLFDDPRVPYLLVRDAAGRCEGLVTRSRLLVFLARSWYTERTFIRDTTHQRGPFARPAMALEHAAEAMRIGNLRVWPVVDDKGHLLGVLSARHVAGLLSAARQAVSHATSQAARQDSSISVTRQRVTVTKPALSAS
ncbi:CBS domain-containing protein [Streptacidiphilus fuscans]|uniref:CBS domain-containing protein n=1 Tax=Streptacidiphilus fuscans TaxID=2789292 RepID=A0A931B9I1_9ACTN|nr:CBS domain-containing protein [Streptacidiphilus fuscans]MBF9072551.1 CBS domain-containing protein [Streptacidiphilus fuscans]